MYQIIYNISLFPTLYYFIQRSTPSDYTLQLFYTFRLHSTVVLHLQTTLYSCSTPSDYTLQSFYTFRLHSTVVLHLQTTLYSRSTLSDYTLQSFYTFRLHSTVVLHLLHCYTLLYYMYIFICKCLSLYFNYSSKRPHFCTKLFQPDDGYAFIAEIPSLLLNEYMLY